MAQDNQPQSTANSDSLWIFPHLTQEEGGEETNCQEPNTAPCWTVLVMQPEIIIAPVKRMYFLLRLLDYSSIKRSILG